MEDEARQIAIAFKQTFNTEAGRTVLATLKDWALFDAPTIPNGQPLDTNWLIFYEAQRSLIQRIEKKVAVVLEDAAEPTAITEKEQEHAG
jgi:hypothetical protein